MAEKTELLYFHKWYVEYKLLFLLLLLLLLLLLFIVDDNNTIKSIFVSTNVALNTWLSYVNV